MQQVIWPELRGWAGLGILLLAVGSVGPAVAQHPVYPPLDVGRRTIYEVNIRQYTPEGTFAAFTRHIPRLADMGVGVLWLMPVHPIGVDGRKGALGSYYAPSDYTAVNPEFGSDEDFRRLVEAAHAAGMYVILDWVPNHTSKDHVWTRTHPGRFTKDAEGNLVPPNKEWLDVIDLNYDNPDTRRAMTDALLYWVKTFGVDGFRCDVAEAVPEDYWRRATMELLNERPVFMLAEGAKPSLHTVGFDGSYGWGFAGVIQAITQGKQPAGALNEFVLNDEAAMPGGPRAAFRMLFTSNHDWNSWEKTGPERFGPALEAATMLTFTAPGMPLIYSGQEAGETKRLKFFDKDEIEWKDHPQADLCRRLAVLKRENAALWHGALAGRFVPLSAEGAEVVAFAREGGGQQVVTVANLTGQAVMVTGLRDPSGAAALAGRYLDLYGTPAALPMQLGPWTAVVLVREH